MEHIVNIVHPVPIPSFWVNPGRGHGKCQLHQLYLGGSPADDLRNRTDRAPTNRTYDSLLQMRAVDLNRPTPKGPNPVAAVAVIARRVVSARRAAQDGVVSPYKRPDDVRCSLPGDPRRGRAPFGALRRRSSVTMKWIRWGRAPHCPSHAPGARRPDSTIAPSIAPGRASKCAPSRPLRRPGLDPKSPPWRSASIKCTGSATTS